MWGLGEPGALPVWHRIERGISSALILTECLRTIDRLPLRAGLGDQEVAERRASILTGSMEIVEIDARVLDRAAQPMPTELGTLDAIHLATAVLWRESNSIGPISRTGRSNSCRRRRSLSCSAVSRPERFKVAGGVPLRQISPLRITKSC